MRRPGALWLAAVLVAVATLSGCGGDETGAAHPDPRHDDPELPPKVVRILSATAAGGRSDPDAVVLRGPGGVQGPGARDRAAGLRGFTAQFTRSGLAEEIRTVVRSVNPPAGMTLVGAVVSIGCDVPSDVSVHPEDEGTTVTLEPVWTGVERLQECFAPVTSVALVLVDSHWLAASL